MNIRMKPIRNRDDIQNIVEDDKCIYIGFRPSSKDLIQIIKTAPALKVVYIPESYTKTLSQSMIMLLEIKKIQLMIGGIQSSSNVESCFILNDVNLSIEETEPVNEPVEDAMGEAVKEPEPVSEPVDEPEIRLDE